MGRHLIRRESLGVPQSARDVFALLTQCGWMDAARAEGFKRRVGFRNIAAHDYQALQQPITVAIIQKHLGEFLQFSQGVLLRDGVQALGKWSQHQVGRPLVRDATAATGSVAIDSVAGRTGWAGGGQRQAAFKACRQGAGGRGQQLGVQPDGNKGGTEFEVAAGLILVRCQNAGGLAGLDGAHHRVGNRCLHIRMAGVAGVAH